MAVFDSQKHTWQEVASKNNAKSAQSKPPTQPPLKCPECGSSRIWKDGLRSARSETDGDIAIQRYLCRDCGRRFSEDTGLGSYLRPNRHVFNLSSGPSTCQVSVTEIEGTKNLSHQRTRQKQATRGATKLSPEEIKGKIIEYSWYLKRRGYAEATALKRVRVLKRLVKLGANLYDSENVKHVLALMDWNDGSKVQVRYAYESFLEMEGLTWEPPRYRQPDTLPWVPLEEEIDQLINACGTRAGLFLEGLKETGADPGELIRVEWTDINEKSRTLAIRHPVKRHNPRILPISKNFIERLNLLPKRSERIFAVTLAGMRANFSIQRKSKAKKFNNPRLLKITFTSIRHWKATTEYHKTKDILHVKQLLGHKSIQNTMVYIDVERAIFGQLIDEEFTSRVAHTIEEDRELIEAGFEYITERDGVKIYRKRK